MLKVSFQWIKPGEEEHLREWFKQLERRADEVRATFADETVRHEQAYFIPTPQGTILVYGIEAEDLARGRQAFLTSTHAIDAEHKAMMKQTMGEPVEAEKVYDLTAQ